MKKFLLLMIIPFCIPPPYAYALYAISQQDAAPKHFCRTSRRLHVRASSKQRTQLKKRKRILYCALGTALIAGTALLTTFLFMQHTQKKACAKEPLSDENPPDQKDQVRQDLARTKPSYEERGTPALVELDSLGLSPIRPATAHTLHVPWKPRPDRELQKVLSSALYRPEAKQRNDKLVDEQEVILARAAQERIDIRAALICENACWLASKLDDPAKNLLIELITRDNIPYIQYFELIPKLHNGFFSAQQNFNATQLIQECSDAWTISALEKVLPEPSLGGQHIKTYLV
jgi:hypothetical protein